MYFNMKRYLKNNHNHTIKQPIGCMLNMFSRLICKYSNIDSPIFVQNKVSNLLGIKQLRGGPNSSTYHIYNMQKQKKALMAVTLHPQCLIYYLLQYGVKLFRDSIKFENPSKHLWLQKQCPKYIIRISPQLFSMEPHTHAKA